MKVNRMAKIKRRSIKPKTRDDIRADAVFTYQSKSMGFEVSHDIATHCLIGILVINATTNAGIILATDLIIFIRYFQISNVVPKTNANDVRL
jgi:hypothetical protein